LWEWCEDLYRPGTNWRVLRGGAWTSRRSETMASSHRTHDPDSYRSDSVGFRCVLE
jgi:formylglycine-generating enzyme required for sulfatase activity